MIIQVDEQPDVPDDEPWPGPSQDCTEECLYGTCMRTMGDPYGCGGCCACLGGCAAEYEDSQTPDKETS